MLKTIGRALLLLYVLITFNWMPFWGRSAAWAHVEEPSGPLEHASFEQRPDVQLPLNLTFADESGRQVRLKEYFGGRPVMLIFAYYECPMLCSLALNDLTSAMKDLDFEAGKHFEVLTVSFDPGEGPELAGQKKATYLEAYGRAGAEEGWHFLTGKQPEIDRLTEAAGFHAVYDPERDEYAHPTGVILLTPEGRISRYIFGIGYTAQDLRLGLVEASQNKIGSPIDQFFLLCYHYDPATGKYTPMIQNIIRIAGLGTVALLGGTILMFLAKERRGTPPGPENASP